MATLSTLTGTPGTRNTAASPLRFPVPPVPMALSLSYWLLLLFLILLYANLPLVFPASEAVRPAKIAAGLAIAALLGEALFGSHKLTFAWPEGGWLIAFLSIGAMSCFAALWPGYAFDWLSNLVKMVIVFFFIVNCADNERAIKGVMWTMILGGLFPALGTLRNFLQGNLEEGRASWVGIFANPNEMAYAMVVLLPLAAYVAAVSGWLARITLLGISLLYLAALFVTFSRGGVIGLGAIIAVYAWRKRSVALQVTLVVLVVAGTMVANRYWTRGENFSQLNNDVSLQQRFATYQAGLAMFLDRPLLGVGLGCSVVAWPLYAPQGALARGTALVTHNTLIQALSETGILGFTSFVTFIGIGLYRARKLARSPDKRIATLGTSIEAAIWGMVVCGMSGGYVLTWFPYILLGLAGAARRIVWAEVPAPDGKGRMRCVVSPGSLA